MATKDLVLGIILLVASVFLVVAVLLQSGKSHNLSGSIAGGAETFFGKTKGKTIDKMLSKITTVVSILFVLLVIVVYIIQPEQPTATAQAVTAAPAAAAAEDIAEDTSAAEDIAVVTEPADDTVADSAAETDAAEVSE